MIKARVHLILFLQEHDPTSFRTDVLALTRDAQWVFDQAVEAANRAVTAIGLPVAHQISLGSIEWVPTLRERTT